MTQFIYEVITNELGQEVIKKTDPDGKIWWIPPDPANSDYQRYLNPNEVEHLTEIPTDEPTTKSK